MFKNKYVPIQIGERFGLWTVTNKGEIKHNQQKWVCVCDCGVIQQIASQHLRNGNSTKCIKCSGRIRSENTIKKHLADITKLPYENDRRNPWVAKLREVLFEQQKGVCPVCEKPLPIETSKQCVDHDHNTGYCRALVHHSCNLWIGFVEANEGITRRVDEYLARYRETSKTRAA